MAKYTRVGRRDVSAWHSRLWRCTQGPTLHRLAAYYSDLSLLSHGALNWQPSLLAAAALSLAIERSLPNREARSARSARRLLPLLSRALGKVFLPRLVISRQWTPGSRCLAMSNLHVGGGLHRGCGVVNIPGVPPRQPAAMLEPRGSALRRHSCRLAA